MTTILLVEDNPLNQDMLSRRLTRQGYEVVMAIDGAAGLAMAKAKQPDLILMDMNIPVIDGWEATRRLKADSYTQTIPIIALTAHAMANDREKAIAAGCDEYATKPVEFKQLLKTIRAFVPKGQAESTRPSSPQSSLFKSDAPHVKSAPMRAATLAAAPADSSQKTLAGDLPFTLLVVNDNDTSRDVLSAHLQRKGYTVVSANSRVAALEILQQFAIDLVLLDITLPETADLETLQHIRQTHSKTALPVIMISVKDTDEEVVLAFEMGANDYVTKPINLAIVMARIQSQLEIQQASRSAVSPLAAPSAASSSEVVDNGQLAQSPQMVETAAETETETAAVTAVTELDNLSTPVADVLSVTDDLPVTQAPSRIEAPPVAIAQKPKAVAEKAVAEKAVAEKAVAEDRFLDKESLPLGKTPSSKLSLDRYPPGHTFSTGPFSQMRLAERPEQPDEPLQLVEIFSPNLKEDALLEDLRTFASIEYAHLKIISQNKRILGVLDFWEQDQAFYWSQTYTEGHLFSEEIKPHQPLPPEVVLKVVKGILEALQPFHLRQVVHSAIQPDHLWRCQQDGHLKLLNLGLSRRLLTYLGQRSPRYRLGLSQQHDYMPIEQRIAQATLSSDIYAVGVIALQMLTGEAPSVLANTLLASHSPWHQLGSSTPEMSHLLSKMLPPNPRKRYSSALVALQDMSTFGV